MYVHCTVPGVCKEEKNEVCHLRVHETGGHVGDLKHCTWNRRTCRRSTTVVHETRGHVGDL